MDQRIKPLADEDLQAKVEALLKKCVALKQLKKGANECTKALNRSIAELVIIAADTCPIEIVLHLPMVCEDKNVPFIFVSSKTALGKALGTTRDVTACVILKDSRSTQNKTIQEIKNECEVLFINC